MGDVTEAHADVPSAIVQGPLAQLVEASVQSIFAGYPDMKGFSPRNLKHMRAFAAARPERAIVQQLVAQFRQRFLLELGSGFAFVGRQVHLEFANHGYYLDLLFYHLKLRCYVVIELKAVPFHPAFIGQINVYLSAVDDLLPHPDDKPTIGLLLWLEAELSRDENER